MSNKRPTSSIAIRTGICVAAFGFVLAVGMTVASGVDYAMQQADSGSPGPAPWWAVLGTYAGLVTTGLGLGLVVVGAVLAASRRRMHAD